MAITSVEQVYESTESWYNYKTGIETTFGGKEVSMDIGKSKDNYNKDERPKYFNCNIYNKKMLKAKKRQENQEILQI